MRRTTTALPCLCFILVMLLPGPCLLAQQRTLRGEVTDEQGVPLPGVTVEVKGTPLAVPTSAEGAFSIDIPGPGTILVFSFIGYQTQEVAISEQTMVNVQLEVMPQSLNEVIVVGFGTQKKINLTGAVSHVEGEVLQERQVANVGQALQGLVPNLNLTTTGDPGGPGQNASFNIRGNTTVAPGSNASPLFVVDGITVDNINDINPNDIESISVLKDAAASAIYGARAPYGVVLVTTRSGKKGEKARVNYSTMVGRSTYTKLPDMASSLDFAKAFNIASVNSGQGEPFSKDILEKIQANIANPGAYPVSEPDPSDPSKYTYASPTNTDNVDWFEAYFKPWSFNQKHDLSLSGGSNNTTYFVGTGFYNQTGQLRYADEVFNRYNVTANIHTEPLEWLRADLRTRFAKRENDNPFDYAGQMGNWIHMATTRHPNWALRNPDGHFSHSSNLEFLANGGRRTDTEDDFTITGSLEAEPVAGWKVNMDYSYNNQATRSKYHSAYVYAWGTDGSKYNIGPSLNSVGESMISDTYQSFNVYTSYEKNLKKHHILGLLGHQMELYRGFALNGERSDLITDAIPAINTAAGTQFASDNIPHWATQGTFARLNYNYDEKYLLEVNGRYDGTSRFPEGRRYGFFPSVSAGYNLARENYWEPLKKYVNDFKIRASYGSLGNQNVTDYLYLATVPIGSNLPYILAGIRPNYLQSPGLVSADLTWETSRTFDIGLDAAFLDNRLNLTYDWYVRNTLNMLGPASVLPATLGVGVPYQNNADMQTRGFELSISWRDRAGEDFNYHVSFVLSDYLSEIKQYYNPSNLLSDHYPGKTIGEIWGLETAGLIQTEADLASMPDQSFFNGRWTPGDVLYTDLNGDGKIDWGENTLDNHGDLKVIGNSTPRYSFGLNLGFSWKKFDFNMFWQGVAKRDYWLGGSEWNNQGNIFWGFTPGFGNNVYEATLDFWTPENADAYFPKPYLSAEGVKNHRVQSRYLQNAAYARLKSLQLAYDFSSLAKRIRIGQLRVFVSGENLLTFTGLHKNYDPEVIGGSWGTGKIYPLLKTISLGTDITF